MDVFLHYVLPIILLLVGIFVPGFFFARAFNSDSDDSQIGYIFIALLCLVIGLGGIGMLYAGPSSF